jgi:hypothetical protein
VIALHAQYFRSSELRSIVSKYWDAYVTDEEKEAVKRALRANYAIDRDRELLLNEFQAYVLMHRAEGFELAAIVPAHREPLHQQLANVGIHPIQFQLGPR